jgi:hypothetical protein
MAEEWSPQILQSCQIQVSGPSIMHEQIDISISTTIDSLPMHWLFDPFSELRDYPFFHPKIEARRLTLRNSASLGSLQNHITPTLVTQISLAAYRNAEKNKVLQGISKVMIAAADCVATIDVLSRAKSNID